MFFFLNFVNVLVRSLIDFWKKNCFLLEICVIVTESIKEYEKLLYIVFYTVVKKFF